MIANAKKHITGKIAVNNNGPVQALKLDVTVNINGTDLETFTIDPGPGPSGATGITGDPAPAYDIDIPIPATLNKKAIRDMTLTLRWRQNASVIGSWVEMENPASYIEVPTFRKVR
jgi:hypothetical protein